MYESSNAISYKLQQLSGWLYDGRQGYSLGYLLRKLPQVTLSCSPHHDENRLWTIWNSDPRDIRGNKLYTPHKLSADTPEDAAGLLAIKLFEEGILK